MSALVKPFLLFDKNSDSLKKFRLVEELTNKWSLFVILIEAFGAADELNPILTKLTVDIEQTQTSLP
jgi:hypothetical protein